MSLHILLLKKDTNQTPDPDTDLHPPARDVLGQFFVTGSHDAVLVAAVPFGFSFDQRKRLPLDGDMYVVENVLEVLEPLQTGFGRW